MENSQDKFIIRLLSDDKNNVSMMRFATLISLVIGSVTIITGLYGIIQLDKDLANVINTGMLLIGTGTAGKVLQHYSEGR